MRIEPAEAHALLDEVDAIVRQLKQSNIYRISSTAMMAWGIIVALGYALIEVLPRHAIAVWVSLDLLGIALTVAIGHRQHGSYSPHHRQLLLALALFFGFGIAWSLLGRFGGRELDAFWPTLFMFGYALAGLLFGLAFTVIGIAIALLTFAGYVWSGTWFDLYLALVDGGGLVLCGLWMRRA